MKRLRFQSGIGNGEAVIPGGQILSISMVPGTATSTGSWIAIGNAGPIWVPYTKVLDLGAKELGECCGQEPCDQWPGDQQIRVVFGEDAAPSGAASDGDPPLSWLVVYNGP